MSTPLQRESATGEIRRRHPTLMRCFVALELPTDVRAALAEIAASPQWPRGVRAVARENLHLTLLFLGEIAPAQLPQIEAALLSACDGQTPFELNAQSLGCFPNERRPRVLWAGLNGAVEALRRLQSRIETALLPLAPNARGGSFSPHVTLARLKSPTQLEALLRSYDSVEFGRWNASEVVLMESELTPRGAIYTHRAVMPLNQTER